MAATEQTIDVVSSSAEFRAATTSGLPSIEPLNTLQPGNQARIVTIDDAMPEALRSRVMSLGFVPGTLVKVVRKAPLGDPIEYELRGGRISLRKTEARFLRVSR